MVTLLHLFNGRPRKKSAVSIVWCIFSLQISGMSVLCSGPSGCGLRDPIPGICVLSGDSELCVWRARKHHRCPVRQPDGIQPGRHPTGIQVKVQAPGGEDGWGRSVGAGPVPQCPAPRPQGLYLWLRWQQNHENLRQELCLRPLWGLSEHSDGLGPGVWERVAGQAVPAHLHAGGADRSAGVRGHRWQVSRGWRRGWVKFEHDR